MRIELHGEVERAILSRFQSGAYRSVEEVIAEAFLPPEGPRDVIKQKQKQAATSLFNKLAAMPMESSDVHFSGRDHDRILYGDPPA